MNSSDVNTSMKIWISFTLLFPLLSAVGQDADTLFYQDGSIKSHGMVDANGKKIHDWYYHYPSGIQSAKLRYASEERLDGEQLYYSEEGNLIALENWKLDVLHDSSWYYFSNGQLEKKGVFVEGLYQGQWVFYHENGNLRQVGIYDVGYPNGLWKFFFENGQLNQEGELVDGKEHGLWRYYDEEGNSTYVGEWKNGQKTGQWYFFKKGKKKPWKKFD